MQTHTRWSIQTAKQEDRDLLSALLSTARWNHQHLDWVNIFDLLGATPFLLALERGLTAGCLACPPDPNRIAWLRLFAVAPGYTPSELWRLLWPEAVVMAASIGVEQVAALVSGDWLSPLLQESGFSHTNDVIFLEWHGEVPPRMPIVQGKLREMDQEDLPKVAKVDQNAFSEIWQYSLETLMDAFQQVSIATVVEVEGHLVAYQMSTASIYGAHLARLAVASEWQGMGIGKALVIDTLCRLTQQGINKVTVNTQVDNVSSLRIYRGLGFEETESRYPVYQFKLDN